MSIDPDKPVSRTTLCLLLGICAGAGGLLYLHKRRTKASPETGDAPVNTSEMVSTPRPGDILLFHNARGMNRLITGFTRSPFYHAALYAGDGSTVEARTPGVLRQDLRGRETDFIVIPAPDGKGKAALAWAETQVGDAYDYRDLAVIILDHLCRFLQFNYTSHGKFSCGEFVATAFAKAGVILFPDRELNDVVPGDFVCLATSGELQQAR